MSEMVRRGGSVGERAPLLFANRADVVTFYRYIG